MVEAIKIMRLCKPLANRLRFTLFRSPITEYEGAIVLKLVEVIDTPYWDDLGVWKTAGLNATDWVILRERLNFHFRRADMVN